MKGGLGRICRLKAILYAKKLTASKRDALLAFGGRWDATFTRIDDEGNIDVRAVVMMPLLAEHVKINLRMDV